MDTEAQQEPAEGSMRALIASTIAENMQKLAAQQPSDAAPQDTVPQVVPVPQAEPVPQHVTVGVPQPAVQVSQEQAAASTAPVADMDIAAMFKTQTTEAPGAPAPLPPDTPVQAPPEIEGNEKAKSAWEILRARERESRHRAEALQAQLEGVTKQAGTVAEERARFADELKNRDDRIHELEDRLGKLDLASRPEFREQYDNRMESVAESFRSALNDAAEIDESALDDMASRLLSVNDADFNRLVAKLPATAQGSLWDKRREFRDISTARERAIAEWRTAQAGVEETADQRRVVEHAERRGALAEQAIDFTNTQLPPDRRPTVLSESTYKADVDSANRQFRGFMQVASDDEIARVAYQGFLVPVMQRQVAYLAEALGKWRDAYYAIRGAGAPPALPIRVQSAAPAAPAAPPPPRVEDRGGSFSSIVQDTLAGTIRQAMGR